MNRPENRFLFDATPPPACSYPMPKMSEDARALLAALLVHAMTDSPGLHVRDHAIPVSGRDLEDVSAPLLEVLHTAFHLPWGDSGMSVCTIDHAMLRDGAICYRVNELYAAYLIAVGVVQPAALRVLLRGELERQAIGLDDREWALVIEALQCYHLQQSKAWTAQAVFVSRSGGIPAPRDAFALTATEQLLHKMGAVPAP